MDNADLKEASVLILANKKDLPSAMSDQEVVALYGLQEIRTHQYHLQGCCGLTGEGLAEAFTWLSEEIISKAKSTIKQSAEYDEESVQ